MGMQQAAGYLVVGKADGVPCGPLPFWWRGVLNER